MATWRVGSAFRAALLLLAVGLAVAGAVLLAGPEVPPPAGSPAGEPDRVAPSAGPGPAEAPASAEAPESPVAAAPDPDADRREHPLVGELTATLETRPVTADEWRERASRLVALSNRILALPSDEQARALRGVAEMLAALPDLPRRVPDVERQHLTLNLLRRATDPRDRTLDGAALRAAIGPTLESVTARTDAGRPFRAAGLILARIGHPEATAALVRLARRRGRPIFVEDVRDPDSVPLLVELALEQHGRMASQDLVPALVWSGDVGRTALRELIAGLGEEDRAGEWKGFIARAERSLEYAATRGVPRSRPFEPWPDPETLEAVLAHVEADRFSKADSRADRDRLLEIPDEDAASHLLHAYRGALAGPGDRRSEVARRAIEELLLRVRPPETYARVCRAVAEELASVEDDRTRGRCGHLLLRLWNERVLDASRYADEVLPLLAPLVLVPEHTSRRHQALLAVGIIRDPRATRVLIRGIREFGLSPDVLRHTWGEESLALLAAFVREREDDGMTVNALCGILATKREPGRRHLRSLIAGVLAGDPRKGGIVLGNAVGALARCFAGRADLEAIEEALGVLDGTRWRGSAERGLEAAGASPETARAASDHLRGRRGSALELPLLRMLSRWPPETVAPVLDGLDGSTPEARDLLDRIRARVAAEEGKRRR